MDKSFEYVLPKQGKSILRLTKAVYVLELWVALISINQKQENQECSQLIQINAKENQHRHFLYFTTGV